MNTKPKPSAVIFAKEVTKLAYFYQEVIQMQVVAEDDDHVVLDEGGFQLVIHGIPRKIAAQITISVPPELREDTALKICLPVSTIERARQKAAMLGGAIAASNKEWEARSFRACDGYDPEGNVFQVRESL